MERFKKIFAAGVIFVTVLSMSVVVAPKAGATASAGDLIKMSGLSSVYYLAADGKRYVFPNESTYFSWYSDFSGVVTIPQAELESYPLGKNVTVRPGTKLVKITTSPKVYAVTANGTLVAIPDEATAKTLYGANWNKRIIDVSDAFFTNYQMGGTVSASAYPQGSLVKFGTSADVYLINADGSASKVATEAAFLANRFKWSDVITATISMPSLGTAISGAVATLTDTASGAGGTIGAGTGLTVALASDTPASVSVPENGSRIPMTKVKLTASNDGSITVNSIVVKRQGLSAYTELDRVWAEKDGVIVASKKTVNSNDEAILTFSPALVISAGATVSLDILASFNAATGYIGLSIMSASAVSANGATVSGSFPIVGNQMSPTSYSVVTLSLTATSSTAYAPKVGDEAAELAKVTVGFSGTAKDVVLTSLMLKNNGVEDLAKSTMNLFLEQAGNKVSDHYTVNGRYVTFYFPAAGFAISKDDASKIFYVKGDVISRESTSAGSYVFILNKSTDLAGYEKSTGFSVNVKDGITGLTADAMAFSTVNVSSGAVSVSKKLNSPSATTIVKGSDNVVLLANIRADEAMTADGLKITYGSTVSTAPTVNQFQNVRVYLNGSLLDSFDPSATSSSLIVQTIDSSLSLNKGDNEVKVMAQAKTNATASSAFMASVVGSTAFVSQNLQYTASGNTVNLSSDVGGSATGGIFTVQGATLTAVRNDGYSNGKVIVKGTSDVSLGKFVLRATNDAVKVTSIAFGANGSSTPQSSISDAKLFVNGVQAGNTIDFGTSGATFSSLNINVAKDTSVNVELKASFDTAATGGFNTTMTVNANDSLGTTVTGIATPITATFSIAETGTLTVEIGGNTPAAALLATTVGEREIAQVKFTAQNDSIDLTKISFVNTSSTTAAVPTSSADSIISNVLLYDGLTLIDSTNLVSGVGEFNTTGKVTVPANGSKTLSVKITMNNIVNDATATNKDVQFAITTTNSKSSAGTATGDVAPSALVLGNSFRIRKTVPTVTLVSLPSTLLTAGDQVVSKFAVTADTNGDIALKQVVLTYATSSTGVTMVGISNNAVKVNGSTKDIASQLNAGAKTLTIVFATPETISAGTTKTFEVSATLTVSGANSESVTTKINEDASYATDGTGNFVWSDGADILSYTYSNGKRVAGLSTATQVMSK